MEGAVQFRSSILEVFQEDVLLVGGVFVVVVLSSRLNPFVFIQWALGKIPGTPTDEVDDGGALQLHGFVLVARRRVLHVIQMGVGSVEGVVVVSGYLFQVDRTRIIGSVEAMHVEGFAPVEGFVGSSGFDRAGIGRGLWRRTNGVYDRNVDGGRV